MGDRIATIGPADEARLARAAELLRSGGLVAFPTETVYGLGADATNDCAVAGIFETKGRPRFNPLIVHVQGTEQAHSLAKFTPAASRLARAFWPGPLTLVLPRHQDCPLSLLVSAGLDTVALRVPAHPVAQTLLTVSGLPIAAPSANRSGRVSPTQAKHVAADFGTELRLILDGGPAICGIESTVIGFNGATTLLLRPGALPRGEIERVAGPVHVPSSPDIRSPGQLRSHYAPRAMLRLNAETAESNEAFLAFGEVQATSSNLVRNLSPSGDLKEAAANLFAMLRELDASGTLRIAVMPIPDQGLGESINDRLRRAAAAKDD